MPRRGVHSLQTVNFLRILNYLNVLLLVLSLILKPLAINYSDLLSLKPFIWDSNICLEKEIKVLVLLSIISNTALILFILKYSGLESDCC